MASKSWSIVVIAALLYLPSRIPAKQPNKRFSNCRRIAVRVVVVQREERNQGISSRQNFDRESTDFTQHSHHIVDGSLGPLPAIGKVRVRLPEFAWNIL